MLTASQSRKSTFQSTGATWEDLRKEVYSHRYFLFTYLIEAEEENCRRHQKHLLSYIFYSYRRDF